MPGILLCLGIVQSCLVVLQLCHPRFQFCLTLLKPLSLDIQLLQGTKLLFQFIPLGLRLGQQAGFIVPAFVLEVFQCLRQLISRAAFISGGHQIIQPAAQRVILGHRHVGQLQKARPDKNTPLHAQQFHAAVGGGQLRHVHAGFRLVCPKLAKNQPSTGAPLDGNIPAIPADVHPALHGRAGPGSITFLICQGRLGSAGLGVDAIQHGNDECAPGTLAPFIGSFDDIHTRLQGQGLMLQLAEGGCHGIDLHGNTTSCPSRICREIRAANLMRCFSTSLSVSSPSWRMPKYIPSRLSSPTALHSSFSGMV